jgi:outer membrane protein OmpA-like peptidoglycan-associated protein
MMRALSALVFMLAGAAQAVELQLPATARQVSARDTVQDRFFAPTGPFADGAVPTVMIEGDIVRSAWRIDVAGLTPLQLVTPLRVQLRAAGFDIVLDCTAQVCGGYDFRFASEVLPAPNMYVNIRDYHVLTALRGPQDAPDQAVNVLASASGEVAFVQIIQAGAAAQDAAIQPVTPAPAADGAPRAADALLRDGHVVLAGLDFESGTSELGPGPFAVLEQVVEVLRARPDLRLALVGHTDNTGSLAGNIALSVARADAVRRRLIEAYAIAPARLDAEGMGYLAPFTTNTTETGREANRRVEAVVLSE